MPTPTAAPTIPRSERRPRRSAVASSSPASASRPDGFARTVAAAPTAASAMVVLADLPDQRATAVAADMAATGTSVIPAATYVANTLDESRTPTASGGIKPAGH